MLAFATSNSASGDNAFLSDGRNRTVRLIRSGSAPNPAIIFTFHARGSQPGWGIDDLGLAGGNAGNYIIVAPSAVGNGNFVSGSEQWRFDGPPSTNPDVILFDDLLTCLHTQVGVNLDRISASGFSAGGLFTSYLLMHRSDRLSAAAVMSGGLIDSSEYQAPTAQPPTMIVWGGTSDANYQWGQSVDPLYESAPYTHSFDLAANDFADRLELNGQLVVRCNHGSGHEPGPVSNDPSRGGYVWPQNWPFRYLYDHVRGQPSPYETSFPAGTMPSSCTLPPPPPPNPDLLPCLVGGNVINFDGQAGDYIHPTDDTVIDGSWSLSSSPTTSTPEFVRVYVVPTNTAQGLWWNLVFESPFNGTPLQVGDYPLASRWPFNPQGTAGLDVTGDGRGCNQSSGLFHVYELAATNGVVTRFTATFEQSCELIHPPLRGCVHFEQ